MGALYVTRRIGRNDREPLASGLSVITRWFWWFPRVRDTRIAARRDKHSILSQGGV